MSDLFYPSEGSTNKYNSCILEFIPQLLYTVHHTPGEPMAVVMETPSTDGAETSVKTMIPAAYYRHVERFLWRFYSLYTIYEELHLQRQKVLLPAGITLFQRMLLLMDMVIEQLLLSCFNLGTDLKEDSRVLFFDMYLTTEFVVGFHDPGSVDAWRIRPENRHLDLERIDPFKLGEFISP